MKRLFRSLSIVFLIFLHFPLLVTAQGRDPLEMSRDYPPSMFKADVALEQMQWRLKQLREMVHEQEKLLHEIDAQIASNNDQISEYTQQLPIELRYANEDVRSKLIGDVLRELLGGRLEVAGQKESIAQFTLALEKSEKDLTKVDGLKKRKYEIYIRASEQKLSAAKTSFAQAVLLSEQASISQSELNRQKHAYEMAQMELEHSLLDYELEKSSRFDGIANRLVEARISLQPAKARVAAAEQFLKLFSESHDKFDSMSELSRNITNLNEKRLLFERRIWDAKEQISELGLLLKMTKSGSAAFEKQKKPQEKK